MCRYQERVQRGIGYSDPPREATGLPGSNCFSREIRTAQLKTKTTTKQQRKNNNARTPHPLMEFSGSIHAHNIYLDGKQ